MVELNLYIKYESWYRDSPDAVIKGRIIERNEKFIEILDENNYTQILMLDKFFAITYRKGEYLY